MKASSPKRNSLTLLSEQRSMEQLYDQYYDQLVLWADTILGDMNLAEDVVQELFIRLWEKDLYKKLEGDGVKSYLYAAVRNAAVRGVKGKLLIDHLPDLSLVERVWEDADCSHDEVINKLLYEIEQLPPRTREVLVCVHLKNMKYVEVAEQLGISVSTVKTILVRCLKVLRTRVSGASLLLYLCFKYSCKLRGRE